MADRIQIRRDTAANWTSANPTLAQGEIGFETDTGALKVGDGSTAWTSLDYSFGGDAVSGPASATDNNLATFDGTTGKLIQDSGVALPTGALVGTTDSQTLTNKTIGAATLSGTLSCADNTVSRPILLDYAETTNAIGSIGGGTQDIDLTAGNCVTATVDTSATTFTFSNPTASDDHCGFVLYLTNGGSQTVTWPTSVDWAGGTAPTLTASGLDILVFTTVDGGTTWFGTVVGQDMQ